ncbi:MAG TPA: toll/interleukin-1 receptor domain-containing protein, partial [Myxococcaceae bacterium]|nr:toll/interleukin-1 receptor domain-containing protein [Myxococcaceae bacterium]
MALVFISYQPDCELDATLARALEMELLILGHTVVTGRQGAWPPASGSVDRQLYEAKLILVLVSRELLDQRSLHHEFRLAHRFGKRILPVRVRLEGPLPPELPSQSFEWRAGSDNPRLMERILAMLAMPDPTPAGGKPPVAAGIGLGISFGHPAPPDLGAPPSGSRSPPAPQSAPEPVLLGLSAPKSATPGSELIVRLVAALKAFEKEVQKQLEGLGSPPVTLVNRGCRWKPGTQVQVRLSGTHLTCEPAEQFFEWDGRYQLLDFAVAVAPGATPGSTVLKCDVLIEGVRVAFLTLPLEITAATTASAEPPPNQQTFTEPARTAFASYSSRDRDRVIDMCAVLRNIADLDVFVDFDSLRAGKPWGEQLRREIERR